LGDIVLIRILFCIFWCRSFIWKGYIMFASGEIDGIGLYSRELNLSSQYCSDGIAEYGDSGIK
jgi:hypothetical protein